MTFLLTPGQTHEISMAEQLMEQGAVRRCLGRPKIRPGRVVGDKGYTSAAFRSYLRRRGVFDKIIYRQRSKVERMIGRIKEFRRIATRYEKLAQSYLAKGWHKDAAAQIERLMRQEDLPEQIRAEVKAVMDQMQNN